MEKYGILEVEGEWEPCPYFFKYLNYRKSFVDSKHLLYLLFALFKLLKLRASF